MTNTVALILFLLIVGAAALDLFMGWGGTMATLRIAYRLLDWLIFWR